MFRRTHTSVCRAVAVLTIALAVALASVGGASAASPPGEVEVTELNGPTPVQIVSPFTPAPAVPGVTLTAYGGGTVNDLEFELRLTYNERARAAATVDGGFVTLIPGAPAFVNAAFHAEFSSGLPAGTPLLVVVDAFPAGIQQ